MKAMVLREPGTGNDWLRLTLQEEPRADAGAVLIAVEACGVCRTDLHIVEGEVTARLPIVPGHQVAGRVIEAPDGSGLASGDAVGVGWLYATCGLCRFCASGRENLCAAATFTGCDTDGGFAERMVADPRFVYRLPQGLPSIEAAPLLCAGIIGYRSLRLSGIEPGGKLGLIGFGASAHLAAQVARHWECEIYVFTRELHHRELALSLGAVWAGGADDDPGVLLDAAVIFAPSGDLVPMALRRLDRAGKLAVNAIHMSGIPAFSYDDVYWERSVTSVTNYTRRDAEEFLALAASIPVRPEIERYTLENVNDALLRVKRGEVHGAAVIAMV